MTEYIEPTTERLRWARIHPHAARLADTIGNLAAREGWQGRQQTRDALGALTNEAKTLSERCHMAHVPRISPTGQVLASWAMVAQLLVAWDSHDHPDDRREAAKRATVESYAACNVTAEGRMCGEPWPVP